MNAAGARPPLTPRQRLSAYAGIARVQVRIQLVYRADFIFRLLGLLLQIYLLKLVWTAVYPASGSAPGDGGRQISLATQIAYVTLASVQSWLFNPWAISPIPQRVREGTVAIDLARPVGFTTQMLFAQAGTVLAMAPFAVLALPFAVLLGGAQAPASFLAGLAYVISLVPALLASLLLAAIVSMMAFWTLEVSGIFMIYRMTSQFFAGALVPLWFMPGWLRTVAEWLPFQATTYTPTALYLGKLGGAGEVLTSLLIQCGWVAALWFILRYVWSRALHRVVVQGG